MKIKYKNTKYNVQLKDWFKIWKRKILLILRRIKRFLLRVLEVLKKDLIILFIAIMFYVLAVIIIECNFMNISLAQSLWGTKAEVFTVFVVVSVNSIISYERNWRKNIRNWHDIYVDFMYDFEKDIKELNNSIGLNSKISYGMLYTRDLFEKFEDEIRSIELKDSNFDKIIINNIIIRLERETNELKENVSKNTFLQEKYGFMWNYKSLEDKIYDLKSRLSNLDKYELKEKVISIYEDLYYLISYTRRLWRTEINLEREIIKILSKDNKNKIDNDYYLKAISYEFNIYNNEECNY